jgi:hypothetical protein
MQFQSYSRVSGTAAGTTTIFTGAKNFSGVVTGLTKTGTVSFYDSESGTSSAFLFSLDNAEKNSDIKLNLGVKKGLVAVADGTTDCLVIWS